MLDVKNSDEILHNRILVAFDNRNLYFDGIVLPECIKKNVIIYIRKM